MSTQELSSIALRVVGQYHDAGKALLNAYRTGTQRLIDGAAPLQGQSRKLSDFLSTRLQADTDRVATLIDNVANAQTRVIDDLTSRATQVEQTGTVAILDMIAALQLPQAKLSEQIAIKIAEGAKSIETRVSKDGAEAAAKVAEAAEKVAEAVQDLTEAKPARRNARSAE